MKHLRRINEHIENCSSYSSEYYGIEFIYVERQRSVVPDMVYKNENAKHGGWMDTNAVIKLAMEKWKDRLFRNDKIVIASYKQRSLNNKNEIYGTPDVKWSIKVESTSPLEFTN